MATRLSPIQPEFNDPYAHDIDFCSEDEIDEFADPFVIAAAKEEAAGVPLIFLTIEHHD